MSLYVGSGSRRYSKVEWIVTAVIYGRNDVKIDVSAIQTSLNAFGALYQVSSFNMLYF
jgi:hypothetical protein